MLTSWEEQVHAVEENEGVIVQEEGSVGSQCLIGQVRVARRIEHLQAGLRQAQAAGVGGKFNVVFLAVKQPAIREAAEQAARILSEAHGGVVITLLNGLGHVEVVQHALRNNDVGAVLVHGVYTGGAYVSTPGVVQHAGRGQLSLAVAGGARGARQTPPETLDPLTQQLLARVGAVLQDGGIETEVVPEVMGLVWGKLCVNVAINALTALLAVPNGRLLDSEDTRGIMRDAVQEAHAVACVAITRQLGDEAASACALVADGWEASYRKALAIARDTGCNTSSMLADVKRGSATEAEAIYGVVVREAERAGLQAPTCSLLLRLVRARTELHQPGLEGCTCQSTAAAGMARGEGQEDEDEDGALAETGGGRRVGGGVVCAGVRDELPVPDTIPYSS